MAVPGAQVLLSAHEFELPSTVRTMLGAEPRHTLFLRYYTS